MPKGKVENVQPAAQIHETLAGFIGKIILYKLTNITMANGPRLKKYFVLKMGIFQPAMLVYQRVHYNYR